MKEREGVRIEVPDWRSKRWRNGLVRPNHRVFLAMKAILATKVDHNTIRSRQDVNLEVPSAVPCQDRAFGCVTWATSGAAEVAA